MKEKVVLCPIVFDDKDNKIASLAVITNVQNCANPLDSLRRIYENYLDYTQSQAKTICKVFFAYESKKGEEYQIIFSGGEAQDTEIRFVPNNHSSLINVFKSDGDGKIKNYE
jgi:hypothetical protein